MSEKKKESEPLTCGLVMPISEIDGCKADHWAEVRAILESAIHSIEEPKFKAKLVSEADDVGVIQKRIVQNIYTSDIVVCDVSAKNPNVMFELGMRLAFDKPTVIVKDDQTDYSFDTSPIEHLPYPRGLRFKQIGDFQQQLAQKVQSTYAASKRDKDHSPFLKTFGTFNVARLNATEVSSEVLIIEMVSELQRQVTQLRRDFEPSNAQGLNRSDHRNMIGVRRVNEIIRDLRMTGQDTTDPVKVLHLVRGRMSPSKFFTSLREFEDCVLAALEMDEPGSGTWRQA